MHFRSVLLGLTLGLSLSGAAAAWRSQNPGPAAPSPAPDSEKGVAIRKLLTVTGEGDLGKKIAIQLMDSFKSGGMPVPDEFRDRMIQKIDSVELVNLVIPIYEKHLDLDSIRAMTAFYESPEGKKVLVALPKIMQESMAAGQKWGSRISQQILAELTEERERARAGEPANEGDKPKKKEK